MNSPNNTLSIDAYNLILNKILRGLLIPGDIIPEELITEEIHASRTPVREALLWLQKDGFIEIIPRKGSFIARFSVKDVLEIYNTRLLLEPHSIGQCCINLQKDSISQLKNFNKFFLRYISDDTLVMPRDFFFNEDLDLHLFLFSLIKNNYIRNICIEALYKCILSKTGLLEDLQIKRKRVAAQHTEIIEAILSREEPHVFNSYKSHIISERDCLFNYQMPGEMF